MPSQISSASRTVPSTVMRSLAVWCSWRSRETSFSASASSTEPVAVIACMRNGCSNASCAASSRSISRSSANGFIRKPTEPQFMPYTGVVRPSTWCRVSSMNPSPPSGTTTSAASNGQSP